MGKYLVTARYSAEGAKALLEQGGSARVAAATAAAESLGGSVEAIYFAFGKDDFFGIVDMPDEESIVALALAAGAGGTSVRTTVLLTAEQVDAAAQKSMSYTPPGS